MNVIENICEYPECANKAACEVSLCNSMLICQDHYCFSQITFKPSKLSQDRTESILKDLQKLKTIVKTMKTQIASASEKLVEKILQTTFAKLQELTEEEKKINKIIFLVLDEGCVLPKVLKNIEENLQVQPLSEQNAIDSLLLVLQEYFTDNSANKMKTGFHSHRFSHNFESSLSSGEIYDSRLLSRDTPIDIKLNLLSWSQVYINQQSLLASQTKKPLASYVTLLDSPTILQICPKSKLIFTSKNNNTLTIWEFNNLLTPWKTLTLHQDMSGKIIDILIVKANHAVVTTQSSFYLIDFKEAYIKRVYAHNDNFVQIFKIISNKRIVFGSCSGYLSIFHFDEFSIGPTKLVHKADGVGPFRALEACGNVVVAGGKDGYLKVWLIKKDLFRNLGAHAGEISAIGISDNHHFIATAGDDKYIILWSVSTDDYFVYWKMKHSSIIINLKFSLDTTLILLSTSKNISISNISKFKPETIKSSQLNIISKFFPSIYTSLKCIPENLY